VTRITGTSYEDRFALVISPRILLKMKNVVEKFVEQIKSKFTFSKIYSKIRDRYEMMWKIWWSQRGHRLPYKTAHAG